VKENIKACFGATLTFCFCLFIFHSPWPPSFVSLFPFDSDPGFFFRFLGRHQACMLDEGRDPVEVFPQAVHLPKSHKHQPVFPRYHPASGSWAQKQAIPSSEFLHQP